MPELTPVRIAIAFCLSIAVALMVLKYRPRTVAEKRAARQAAVIDVAPLQIDDSTTPLAGPPGTDAYGYPTQYVDGEILRAMLVRKKYADLTRYFEQFQDAFEKDPMTEYWIGDAANAFETSEPEMLPRLDAWVAATPASFAPYLARGAHWQAVAAARRGIKFIKDTHPTDLKAMEEALQASRQDYRRALAIRPAAIDARIGLMIEEALSGTRLEELATDAISRCPTCYRVRSNFLRYRVPKWGGSYDEMQQIADDASKTTNPKMKALAGYIDLDKENEVLVANGKDNAKALALLDHACGLGEDATFFARRASIHERMQNVPAAKADIEHAVALRPKMSTFLADRAYFHVYYSKDYEAAARDELAALRINPTEGKGIYDDVVTDIIYLGDQAQKAGNEKEALRLFDLGGELAPANQDLSRRRAWLLAGGPNAPIPTPEAAAAMAANVPDDINDVRRMDYGLSRGKRFDLILPIWNAYIAKHPDDGRAYLERTGTFHNLGRNEEALADARKACDLGYNEGCLDVHRLGH